MVFIHKLVQLFVNQKAAFSMVFEGNKDAAFANNRFCFSLFFLASFLYSGFLGIRIKIYIVSTWAVLAILCLTIILKIKLKWVLQTRVIIEFNCLLIVYYRKIKTTNKTRFQITGFFIVFKYLSSICPLEIRKRNWTFKLKKKT